MGFGNLSLLMLGLLIIEENRFSTLDFIYWAIVVALGVARLVDISRFQGRTIEGEPATMRHFRRYAWRLPLIAAGFWITAHLLSRML
jgi:hypothetical protein